MPFPLSPHRECLFQERRVQRGADGVQRESRRCKPFTRKVTTKSLSIDEQVAPQVGSVSAQPGAMPGAGAAHDDDPRNIFGNVGLSPAPLLALSESVGGLLIGKCSRTSSVTHSASCPPLSPPPSPSSRANCPLVWEPRRRT